MYSNSFIKKFKKWEDTSSRDLLLFQLNPRFVLDKLNGTIKITKYNRLLFKNRNSKHKYVNFIFKNSKDFKCIDERKLR